MDTRVVLGLSLFAVVILFVLATGSVGQSGPRAYYARIAGRSFPVRKGKGRESFWTWDDSEENQCLTDYVQHKNRLQHVPVSDGPAGDGLMFTFENDACGDCFVESTLLYLCANDIRMTIHKLRSDVTRYIREHKHDRCCYGDTAEFALTRQAIPSLTATYEEVAELTAQQLNWNPLGWNSGGDPIGRNGVSMELTGVDFYMALVNLFQFPMQFWALKDDGDEFLSKVALFTPTPGENKAAKDRMPTMHAWWQIAQQGHIRIMAEYIET